MSGTGIEQELEAAGIPWEESHGMPSAIGAAGGVIRLAGVDWLDRAACSYDPDPDAWQLDLSEMVGIPPVPVELSALDRDRVRVAREICADCPVSANCLSLARESETVPVGIWAGLDWSERGGTVISPEAERKAAERAAETPEAREIRLHRMRDRATARRTALRREMSLTCLT